MCKVTSAVRGKSLEMAIKQCLDLPISGALTITRTRYYILVLDGFKRCLL
jgi:hypothetical protein